MKKYIAILFVALFAFACAGKQESKAPEAEQPETEAVQEEMAAPDSTMDAEADTTAVMETAEEATE